MSSEEPKYTLQLRTSERKKELNVSTAQVQFWPEYARDFEESVSGDIRRVDLMTNEYHSEHVRRLDTESHGPLMSKALDVMT